MVGKSVPTVRVPKETPTPTITNTPTATATPAITSTATPTPTATTEVASGYDPSGTYSARFVRTGNVTCDDFPANFYNDTLLVQVPNLNPNGDTPMTITQLSNGAVLSGPYHSDWSFDVSNPIETMTGQFFDDGDGVVRLTGDYTFVPGGDCETMSFSVTAVRF